MMGLLLLLLLLGTILICVEMFIPGFGVCGISGLVLIALASIVTCFTIPLGPFIVLGELAILGVVVVVVFNYLKRKQLHGKIILDETLEYEKKDIGDLEYFIGKEGFTKTSLRPFGMADFNGITVEVCSDSVYIPEKTKIKVAEVSNRKIIVKQIELQ